MCHGILCGQRGRLMEENEVEGGRMQVFYITQKCISGLVSDLDHQQWSGQQLR